MRRTRAKNLLVWLCAVLCGLQALPLASSATDNSYYAGVVEMAPAQGSTGGRRASANMKTMIRIIESNLTEGLDILVFPEGVLNNRDSRTYVPHPALRIAPCDSPDYDYFLAQLSCAARSRGIYVVINLTEKEACEGGSPIEGSCFEDDLHSFNTNVVFDRKGRVISRYRKTHLYRGEWQTINVLAEPEQAIFSTDFGVTFGHFICFDMLFYVPAMRLVRDLKIKDIIYPTYWFSELPFLISLQLQEGWAFANDVNLLAADANVPASLTTGTGIYAGRLGRLEAVIHEEATTVLLKAHVPKRYINETQAQEPYELPPRQVPLFVPQATPARYSRQHPLRDYNLDIFSTVLLPKRFDRVSKRVCHGNFCCDFTVARAPIPNVAPDRFQNATYQYRLGAYSGNRTSFQRVDHSALSVCALFACTNEKLYTCGNIFPSDVEVGYAQYFTNLTVTGRFPAAPHRLIMPSTVDGAFVPVSRDMYDWKEQASSASTTVTISLHKPKTDLLTFGIWANYYTTATGTHNLEAFRLGSSHKAAQRAHSNAVSRLTLSWSFAFLVALLVAFVR